GSGVSRATQRSRRHPTRCGWVRGSDGHALSCQQGGCMRLSQLTVALLLLTASALALAQPRAWRDIDFGDQFLVVADKLAQHEDVLDGYTSFPQRVQQRTTPEALLRYARPIITIAGHRYEMRFEFFDGRLFKLSLIGPSYDASYFDTF